ncbi:MAG: hypothetical protein ACPGSD_01725 [Flavobacteriales bacterium]
MKEVYLAYFDYMGFKEFIEKNEDDELIRRMNHIFRDIEMALGQGKYQEPRNGMILSDLSESIINCLNISDTVLFWSNDCSYESLKSLIKTAYEFNWREVGYNFPIRGAIVKGKIKEVSGKQTNSLGGSYSVQCLYGKGLITAHDKAEYQNWSGTVIDQTIVAEFEKQTGGIEFLNEFAIKYKVPYKTDVIDFEEYVLRVVKNLTTDVGLKNMKNSIESVFSQDNKSIKAESVKEKIINTQKFIEYLKDK